MKLRVLVPLAQSLCTGLDSKKSLVQSLLGQCSFRGLMKVIATGFIPLSPLSIFQQWLCGKPASGLERLLSWVIVKKKKPPGNHG